MSKRIQLFILPYAGGSVASFKRLTDRLDKSIDVVTVEYPGRGSRVSEPLADSIWELLDDAIEYCAKRRNESIPYALMGYSMGSVLAYEMLSSEAIKGELIHFFISAEVSPEHRSLELRQIENPTEKRIIERAKSLGGLDERILNNKRFFDIYIKPMVADYRLFFDYRFENKKHPARIKSDTTFLYCDNDTKYEDVHKWEELLDGQFEYHEIGENHFFINSHYELMADIINRQLCS